MRNHKSLSNLHNDLAKCKRLTSLYNEILRLVDHPISIRYTMSPTTTAMQEKLRAGRTTMIVHRQCLLDENVFGADSHKFNPERFLHNKSLLKSKNYMPFGAGSMLCPGRFMVRAEVLIFVALLVERFEISVAKDKPFPELDTKTGAGFGILSPKKGHDVVIHLKKKVL